jgi:hypothetical protein
MSLSRCGKRRKLPVVLDVYHYESLSSQIVVGQAEEQGRVVVQKFQKILVVVVSSRSSILS